MKEDIVENKEEIKNKEENKNKEETFNQQPNLNIDETPYKILIKTQLTNLKIEDYYPFNLTRVINNILTALKFLKKNNLLNSIKGWSRYAIWKKFLFIEENIKIFYDSFWLILLYKNKNKFDNLKDYDETEISIKSRISINYVDMIEKLVSPEKDKFLKIYFDIISQGVFYSFFYAFPKSRKKFDDEFKLFIFNNFSFFFTGLKINPCSKFEKNWKFIKDWYLDLGAGNVLKIDKKNFKNEEINLGLDSKNINRKKYLKKKNFITNIQYSPIINLYLEIKKFKSKNLINPLKIKITSFNQSISDFKSKQKIINEKFKHASNLAKNYKEQIKNKELNKKLYYEIGKIKKETKKHHKRLKKRKDDELERGAHEYANYLVSMFNYDQNFY